MAQMLALVLSTGEEIVQHVDSAKDSLAQFLAGQAPYDGDWIVVGEDRIVRRDSVISVRIPVQRLS